MLGAIGGLETFSQCLAIAIFGALLIVFGTLLAVCWREQNCSVWPLLEALIPLASHLRRRKCEFDKFHGEEDDSDGDTEQLKLQYVGPSAPTSVEVVEIEDDVMDTMAESARSGALTSSAMLRKLDDATGMKAEPARSGLMTSSAMLRKLVKDAKAAECKLELNRVANAYGAVGCEESVAKELENASVPLVMRGDDMDDEFLADGGKVKLQHSMRVDVHVAGRKQGAVRVRHGADGRGCLEDVVVSKESGTFASPKVNFEDKHWRAQYEGAISSGTEQAEGRNANAREAGNYDDAGCWKSVCF